MDVRLTRILCQRIPASALSGDTAELYRGLICTGYDTHTIIHALPARLKAPPQARPNTAKGIPFTRYLGQLRLFPAGLLRWSLLAMYELHVNMKQMDRFKVYSDSVIAFDQIIQSKGRFVTNRPDIYTEWLNEFGIFYTIKSDAKDMVSHWKETGIPPFLVSHKAFEGLI